MNGRLRRESGPLNSKILHFTWRWKVVTTAAIWQRFFPKTEGRIAYDYLMRLCEMGLIRPRTDRRCEKVVWHLTKQGFESIKNEIPDLKNETFLPAHIGHDLIVSAFHLGGWISGTPEGVGLFTEQQLRAFALNGYPAWVPKNLGHLPDGYSFIPNDDLRNIVAVEVELNIKDNDDYGAVALFYDDATSINNVLWVTRSLNHQRRIEASLLSQSKRPEIHRFVSLQDFALAGWHAPTQSQFGPQIPVWDILSDKARTGHVHVRPSPFLDTRKCPHRSKSYETLQKFSFDKLLGG